MSEPEILRITPAQITRDAMEMIRHTAKCISDALVGRRVRVTSEFNGQPFGHSRKSWRGQVCTIKSVCVDVHDGVSLTLLEHEYECMIPADEVEFL